MSLFNEHQDPHTPQARMSLLSWEKEAGGENGAQCGHKGKSDEQGRVGCAISGVAVTTKSASVSQNEAVQARGAPQGHPRATFHFSLLTYVDCPALIHFFHPYQNLFLVL